MRTTILTVTATAAFMIAGCAGHTQKTTSADNGPTPKWAQETGKPQIPPPAVSFAAPEPGEAKPLPRAYPGAPPQIPHDITDMVVTAEENSCLTCHSTDATGKVEEGEAPNVPSSHFVDYYRTQYNRDARKGIQTYRQAKLPDAHGLLGTRYLCTQCHVPQAKVQPWVKSNF